MPQGCNFCYSGTSQAHFLLKDCRKLVIEVVCFSFLGGGREGEGTHWQCTRCCTRLQCPIPFRPDTIMPKLVSSVLKHKIGVRADVGLCNISAHPWYVSIHLFCFIPRWCRFAACLRTVSRSSVLVDSLSAYMSVMKTWPVFLCQLAWVSWRQCYTSLFQDRLGRDINNVQVISLAQECMCCT